MHGPSPPPCAAAGPPAAAAGSLRARQAARAARAAPRRLLRHAAHRRVDVGGGEGRRPPLPAVAKVSRGPAHAPEPLSTSRAGRGGWNGGGAGSGWPCVEAVCGGCAASGHARAGRPTTEPVRAPSARGERDERVLQGAGRGGPLTGARARSCASGGSRRCQNECRKSSLARRHLHGTSWVT